MATTLTATASSRSGVEITGTAADAAGNNWINTGIETLVVNNTGIAACVVTLTYTATFDGATPTNKTISVGAGKVYEIGPFPTNLYNTNANPPLGGVAYSQVVGVQVFVRKTGTG